MLGRRRLANLTARCATLCAVLLAPSVWAQERTRSGEDGLEAARSLFAEALRDEEGNRFLEALQKFQRVRVVRDTPSIEYRIGSCYERLGRKVPAFVAYRTAVVLGQGDDQSGDVTSAAADKLRALARHVARLALVLPQNPPEDMEVRVDDVAIARAAIAETIPLEPGAHLVTATAMDEPPFRSEIVLPEGAQVSLTISLGSRSAATAAPIEPSPVGRSTEPSPAKSGVEGRTAGWISAGGGGALLVASGLLLFARESDISKLNRQCPGGMCPPSNQSDLESTRNRALVEGPLAIALGVGGVLAGGIGAYLVLTATDAPAKPRGAGAHVVPLVAWGTAGIAAAGVFR